VPLGVEQRISQVCEKLQKLVLEYTARSLFKADRLMFALHMVYIMFPKSFGEQEWELFVGKVVVSDKNADLPSWAHPSRKAAFSLLSITLSTFVQQCTLKDAESWSKFLFKSIAYF
jgi:dynein heavy chain 2